MHPTLTKLRAQLENVIAQVQASVPNDEPFGSAHGNWSFPGLTRIELIEEGRSIIQLINEHGSDEIGADAEKRLLDYQRRLQHLQAQTIPQIWGNSGQAVPAYMFTLGGLRKALAPALTKDNQAENTAKLRKLSTQLRGMESRINGLEPRTAQLTAMISRIEQAYEAADQLPTDLESLAEARLTLTNLVLEAQKDKGHLSSVREEADKIIPELNQSAVNAKAVLERCETAYSAATSVGLAAAFTERSNALSKSMWVWVCGLISALGAGSYFGSKQLATLSELFKIPDASTSIISLNFVLSVLSIGAPVWFAWLATKQIGQRFKLSEDYAFKASVSRAYEGFRREAARIDEAMEARLLASALTRLEELPLRLVETESHGSPWHELASSDIVKQAMKAVPGFAQQVKELAGKTVGAVKPVKLVKNKAASSSGEEE